MKVNIGVSARHVHLCEKDFKILFGYDKSLTKFKDLTQPGEYACNEKVNLITEKGKIENVRILGPLRSYTQVEISKTDSYKLGINPPIRNSGDLKGSSSITIVGPKGSVDLTEGCIIATRHIHILPSQMKIYGLEGKEKVNVKLNGEKGGIITNVYLKISNEAFFELHLDTDDANAHLIKNGDIGEII